MTRREEMTSIGDVLQDLMPVIGMRKTVAAVEGASNEGGRSEPQGGQGTDRSLFTKEPVHLRGSFVSEIQDRKFAEKLSGFGVIGDSRVHLGEEPTDMDFSASEFDLRSPAARRLVPTDALEDRAAADRRNIGVVLAVSGEAKVARPVVRRDAVDVVDKTIGPDAMNKSPYDPMLFVVSPAGPNSTIAASPHASGSTERDARNSVYGAVEEPGVLIEPEGGSQQINRDHLSPSDSEKRERRDKPRTRSSDNWTVRRPGKKTGAEAPASDIGKRKIDQSRLTTLIRLVHTNEALCNDRRGRTHTKSLPRLGVRPRLLLVWSADHARSFSGVRT